MTTAIIPIELQPPTRPLTLGEIKNQSTSLYQVSGSAVNITNQEYEQKLAEYNAQKKAYEEAVTRYNQEITAEQLGFRLYTKSLEGQNPYISQQDPLVQKYFYYYQTKQEAKRVQDLLNKAQTVEEYKKIYESLGADLKIYAPTPAVVESKSQSAITIPEGYQGMTTKEGVVFQKIPNQTSTGLPSIFVPNEISLGLRPVQPVGSTTMNMQPTTSTTINLSRLTLEQAKQRLNMEVKPVTGFEKIENTIYANPIYRRYQESASTIAKVPEGIGLLAGTVAEPYFSFGRNEQDTSISGKAYRGLLMFGKTTLVGLNPVTGSIAGGYFIGSTAGQLIQNPVGFGTSAVKYAMNEPFELIGGIAGGVTGKTVRGVRLGNRVTESINEGTFITENIKGIVREKEVVQLNIDAEAKQNILGYIREGNIVRTYDITLKPKTGLESTTPKIKGSFYDVIDQYGNVVTRRTIGNVESEFRGKKITTESIGEAILRIDEQAGKIEGVSETIEKRNDKFTFSRFLESSQLTKYEKTGKKRLIESESDTRILSKEKYKGQVLLEDYGMKEVNGEKFLTLPEYSQLVKGSRPLSKTKSLEYNRLNKEIKPSGTMQVNPLTGEVTGSFTQIQTFKSYGKSESKFINPIYKNLKSFKDKIYPEVSVKEKPSKTSGSKGSTSKDIMNEISPDYIQGGEVGTQKISEFEGKSYLIPYGGEEVIFSNVGSLRGEMLRGSINKGLLSGVIYTPTTTKDKIKVKNIQSDVSVTNSFNAESDNSLSGSFQGVNVDLANLSINNNAEVTGSISKSFSAQITDQQTKQKLKQESKVTNISVPNVPTGAGFSFPEEFQLIFPRVKKEEESGTKEGYIPEALIDSTKTHKAYWKKLSNKPMTKRSALSVSAEYVDNEISARGRIMKVKTNKEIIDTGEDYFGKNSYKFRTFQQKKGVRTNLPNSFIEKQRYRADNPKEIMTLKIEKQNSRRTPFGF